MVATPALTPDRALPHLEGLSSDIRAGAVLDADGDLVAVSGPVERGRMGELVGDLLESAATAAGEPVREIEVSTGDGAVFCVRGERFGVAVVTSRFAISSVTRYDLRQVVTEMEAGA